MSENNNTNSSESQTQEERMTQMGKDIYEYFKSNMISSIVAIVNVIGIVFFLIYFIHIDYLPDLDFGGVMYLLVAMAFVGFMYLVYFSVALVIPGLMWKLGAPTILLRDKFKKVPEHFLLVYIIQIGVILLVLNNINYFCEDNCFPYALLLLLLLSFIFPLIYIYCCFRNENSFFEIFYIIWMQYILIMIVTVTTWAILFDPDVGSWKIIGIILGVSFIYLLINSLVFVLPNLLIIFFVPLILFLVLLSIGKIDIISSTAVKALHMGNFKANVIFKSNYCEALKNYNILTDKRSDTSCSVRVNNVHWRVGKESLLEIKDKNITVPSDQIISMQWPVDKNTTNQENNVSKLKIISFDFNSTVLTKSGKANLITQAKALDANKTKEITVYGCASPDGTEKYNKTLSLKRAETVKTWLDGYLARDAKDIKINVVGEGTSKHCTDEKLEKELQEHRKVIIE